ncbi:hypothetical protein ALC62_07534 [Cyphomyrmex costatus]|uniref:Uncharacterized protein n=1 Tax=Cyphomyrmex costatus TaxID=456900 RepID=A0A151IHR9_9HYME|nr:hypothetical protein ALC62_07534 [Cyphomyrmex costatus]
MLDTVDIVPLDSGGAVRGDVPRDDDDDDDMGGEYPIALRANYITMNAQLLRKMTDILNVKDDPVFDDRIDKIETHTYIPFANTTFGYSNEIRIPIQQQDLYTLPYESFLYVEGKLTKTNAVPNADVALGNNCVAFMFDEIRYELDGACLRAWWGTRTQLRSRVCVLGGGSASFGRVEERSHT